MTHYRLTPQRENKRTHSRERWESFAAFLAFVALVALAGATYGSLRRGDIYEEVQSHSALHRFAGVLESSDKLSQELEDKSRNFTIIAPSDAAFHSEGVVFLSDDEKAEMDDKRIIRLTDGASYLLPGESYVVRSFVLPHDIPTHQALNLPAANGKDIRLERQERKGHVVITVNGIPVRDRIVADNGIVYIVDSLIYPLPKDDNAMAVR